MKLDIIKTHKPLYTATAAPQLVTVPEAKFLAISGKGDPDGSTFSESVQALYTAAYSIKNHYKQQQQDFVVCKLEGLWWVDEAHALKGYQDALQVPRSEWHWQLLIHMPGFVMTATAQNAIASAFSKKKLPRLQEVSLITFEEGRSVQALHTGPFSTEPATLARITDFMAQHQLQWNGRHHEIYLSDPRRTPPEKLRTILREPVR
ncbi:GyrI-like domain-containing protein [Chitinophaga japonensis]|uniref:GyrI-like small molecule binding domain-containing protein n=1 Tax=Chitinophaga japonensis TaxID=104662 RepID=A0A562TEA4_CHIJA|nr:GyrI-like domain-containing protein [Chitinophaga japonensis]TWI91310.1 hypothetical protein LX66_0678 [Chitinophaga japonensis]